MDGFSCIKLVDAQIPALNYEFLQLFQIAFVSPSDKLPGIECITVVANKLNIFAKIAKILNPQRPTMVYTFYVHFQH